MPERWTPEWFAFGLIDQILGQGRDSRLYQALVQEKGYTSDVSAGINWGLGQQVQLRGPDAVDGLAVPRHRASRPIRCSR